MSRVGGKKIAFHVLGCKVNQYELEAIKELFTARGYEVVEFADGADVYLIHTCTVTHLGDRKSRQYIRKAIKQNPEGIIAVTGCYAQVAPSEIEAIEGVDIVIGTKDRKRIVELVEAAYQRQSKGNPYRLITDSSTHLDFEELPIVEPSRARAFIKIQEGCDNYCTYCIVPYARGPVKSRDPDRTLAEIGDLISKGFKEIVLTGVHIGTYGKDFSNKQCSLEDLLARIVELPGLERLRISSLEPDDITEGLLDLVTAAEVVCPHYHIPLQSGDTQILKRMGRKYSRDDYLRILQRIRKDRPDAAITTDVMVGFPGESELHFNNTVELIKEAAFADLHVFKYSVRRGTAAAKFPNQLPASVKNQRSKVLLALADELWKEYAKAFLGSTKRVLVETKTGCDWEGHTVNYLKVRFSSPEKDLSGKILPITLDGINAQRKLLEGRWNND